MGFFFSKLRLSRSLRFTLGVLSPLAILNPHRGSLSAFPMGQDNTILQCCYNTTCPLPPLSKPYPLRFTGIRVPGCWAG